MKLVELQPKGKFVFVGDTHGDLEASKKVIDKYLKSGTKVIFLGDYVDRGNMSKENVAYLIEVRKKKSEDLILLQGNHENYPICNLSPANFWRSLEVAKMKEYYNIFKEFPLAVSVGNVIALHGALPDINSFEDIDKIKELDKNWMAILWGDFHEGEENNLNTSSGRPLYGCKYFEEVMMRLNKRVLIRGHDPNAKEKMFDNRCLTIFTSSAYTRRRTVAIADFSRKIESINDLVIEDIDN